MEVLLNTHFRIDMCFLLMPVKSFIILLMPAAYVPASEVLLLAAEDFLLNAKAFLQETEAFLSQIMLPFALWRRPTAKIEGISQ